VVRPSRGNTEASPRWSRSSFARVERKGGGLAREGLNEEKEVSSQKTTEEESRDVPCKKTSATKGNGSPLSSTGVDQREGADTAKRPAMQGEESRIGRGGGFYLSKKT